MGKSIPPGAREPQKPPSPIHRRTKESSRIQEPEKASLKSTYKLNKDFKNHDTTLPRKHLESGIWNLETESTKKQSDKSDKTESKLIGSESVKEMNIKKNESGFDNEYERLHNDDELDEQRVDDEGALHPGDDMTGQLNDFSKEYGEARTSKDYVSLQPKLLPSKEQETRHPSSGHKDVGYLKSILNLKKNNIRMKEQKTSNSLPQRYPEEEEEELFLGQSSRSAPTSTNRDHSFPAMPSLPTPDSQSVRESLSRKSSEIGSRSKLTKINDKLSNKLKASQRTPTTKSTSNKSRASPKLQTIKKRKSASNLLERIKIYETLNPNYPGGGAQLSSSVGKSRFLRNQTSVGPQTSL